MPRGLRTSRFSLPHLSQQLPITRSAQEQVPALSPAIRSLYRIFLRATSASVLHHSSATRCLRTRYRPIFEHYVRLHQDQATNNTIGNVLQEWDERIDNTLRLLHNSAVLRGLPHKITRSMSQLVHSRFLEQKHTSHPKYDPERNATKSAPCSPIDELSGELHLMLEETTQLAEGTTRLVLGSTPTKF
ncbi:hypothetical protein AG1IA_03833 [Rhizoctonia solani AG-1 IA]|uniref:Uncharacterized protein n=1 Tax=Thanatephorus cucumeris (strain AG1-IA) TaxID=983506 RepID=L8WVJ9_THACA|nr:hypothetical protein AG1IA_03833 [Rhizoctonia solani AG-1 IA]